MSRTRIVDIDIMVMNVDVRVDVVAVAVNRVGRPSVVISRIVSPIPHRPIRTITHNPKMVVNDRTRYIYRLVNIIVTVHVDVTNHLHLYDVVVVAFDFNRGYILENISFKYGLHDDDVCISFDRFNHPKIIHLAVAIEVEVRDLGFRIVEPALKILEVFGFAKYGRHCPKV